MKNTWTNQINSNEVNRSVLRVCIVCVRDALWTDDQLSSLDLVAESEAQAKTLVALLNRLMLQCQDERTVSLGPRSRFVGYASFRLRFGYVSITFRVDYVAFRVVSFWCRLQFVFRYRFRFRLRSGQVRLFVGLVRLG